MKCRFEVKTGLFFALDIQYKEIIPQRQSPFSRRSTKIKGTMQKLAGKYLNCAAVVYKR